MNYKRRRPPVNQGAPKWMVTFSDLITLILVFFILLFSMSQIDNLKFRALADSFSEKSILDFQPSIVEYEQPGEPISEKEVNSVQDSKQETGANFSDSSADSLLVIMEEVQAFLEKEGLQDVVVANRTERGVVLVLQEQVLFETGEATLLHGATPFLEKVSTLLQNIPNFVKVEGHTDNRPIKTYRYPSNWELSTARASSVIRYFIENEGLDPKRFTAVGYGETRPVAPNDREENWQKNRRVEIIISDPDFQGAEVGQ